MNLVIEGFYAQVPRGATIWAAVPAAIEQAKKRELPVWFIFNDVMLTVYPGSDPAKVISGYAAKKDVARAVTPYSDSYQRGNSPQAAEVSGLTSDGVSLDGAGTVETPASIDLEAEAKEYQQDKKNRGLYGKYFVERTDGKSAPGEKHHGCEYFLLDLTHDKYAVPALRAYAEHCQAEYPHLAADLFAKADYIAAKLLPKVADR